METLMYTVLAISSVAEFSGMLLNTLAVVFGLGLVIFFHELGHFAVAKWCDVHVERFSIGIGPIIWSRQKGETEYAISALPLGGYVKMLGQDDMDPNQMTSSEIAENPRSYSAKTVSQRMAIISAGVIMNVITGFLFFFGGYWFGVYEPAPVVGAVRTGYPAWTAGIEPGDRIISVNDERIRSFMDLQESIVLSSGDLTVGVRRGDRELSFPITPLKVSPGRSIGVVPTTTTTIADVIDPDQITDAGMPSERASTPFLGGDEIFAVRAVPVAAENEDGAEQANGEIPPDSSPDEDARMEVASIADLRKILGRYPEREMVYEVRRYAGEETEPTTVEIRIPPQQVRSLGFWMAMGPVTHIRKDSVAAKAGLREGDTIRAINGLKPGEDLDPLHLPVYFSKLAGQEVTLLVSRSSTNGPDEEELRLIPDDRPGWTETPDLPSSPLTIPSIGAGYRVQPFIARVLPGSEAEGWGVLDAGTRITRVEMVHTSPGQGQPDAYGDAETPVAIELRSDEGEDSATDEAVNFAWAFEQLQRAPGRRLIIHYDNGTESGSKSLESFEAVDDWYLWIRGFHPGIWVDLREIQQADSIPDAIVLGFGRTRKAAVSIYRSLKQMIRRDVDMESLSGPLGIAKIAYRVADRGLIDLLMFLGFLSINLAILNFLPIPILDGGHMVFLIWEGVTRRKPSITVINWAHAAGMLFLLSLFAFVMWIDIFVSDL